MATNIRRLTATTNTIPAYSSAVGTFTTSTTDNKALLYTGADALNTIFPPQDMYGDGKKWIYAPAAGLNKIARVIGLSQTAAGFTIYVDRPMTTSGAAIAFKYIDANLLGYAVVNDGGGNGQINDKLLLDGETINQSQLAPASARTNFQDPVVADANSTSFLITENS